MTADNSQDVPEDQVKTTNTQHPMSQITSKTVHSEPEELCPCGFEVCPFESPEAHRLARAKANNSSKLANTPPYDYDTEIWDPSIKLAPKRTIKGKFVAVIRPNVPNPNSSTLEASPSQVDEQLAAAEKGTDMNVGTMPADTTEDGKLRSKVISAVCFKPGITGHLEQFENVEALIGATVVQVLGEHLGSCNTLGGHKQLLEAITNWKEK